MTHFNSFLFSSEGGTHPGQVRTINQDAFLALPEMGVWAVADGVGGHQRGDTASKAVVDAIARLADADPPDNLAEWVRRQILDVNSLLIQAARRAGPDTIIGSTVAVLVAEGQRCVCLWAGDSRIYGMRRGKLSRLTRDHSQVEDLVLQGRLSAAEAMQHPDANVIYRAVGKSEDLEVDALAYDIYARDKFLLCTDGLTKEVNDEEIAAILMTGACHDNCRTLVDLALSRNCRDNVSVIVVDVSPQPDSEATVFVARNAAVR
ncbi:MAG: protein phosphatase 2C domain-containing protein [Chromatiaceae bacterium]|nr:protein phosphatase 2C domain-containing protein [Chromatiaceae bacterium]